MAGKRIEKRFVLSDSSVNCYGFRLLTSGYQLSAYAANPIGYYMHQRDKGVVLRWEDIRIEGDKITGVPVVNLSNEMGEQVASEIESGFLNGASVGDIIVLEYSDEPNMKLAGQTGPTVTKWYNKECSIVDVPGNAAALALLYSSGNMPITLAKLMGRTSASPASSSASKRQEPPIPQELFLSASELQKGNVLERLKNTNPTALAAVLSYHYNIPVERSEKRHGKVDRQLFNKYRQLMADRTGLNKQNRIAELVAMGRDKLKELKLLDELARLDANAYRALYKKQVS